MKEVFYPADNYITKKEFEEITIDKEKKWFIPFRKYIDSYIDKRMKEYLRK